MQKFVRFVLLVVIAFTISLLSACNGADQPAIQSCIVGIWEVDDAEAFALAVLPPGSVSPQDATYVKGNPELAYKFDSNGTLSVLAVQWDSYHDVETAYGVLPMDLTIDGIADGKFSVDRDIVTLYLVTRSEITHRAVLAGEEMVSSTEANQFMPLFVPPYNAARFQCVGDQLILDLVNRPGVQFTLRKAE